MHAVLNATDRITVLFIILLLCLSLAFSDALPSGVWIVLRFLLLLVAVICVAAYDHHRPGNTAFALHALLPVLIIPVLFDSLGDLIPWMRHRLYDSELIMIDRALFFGHHPTVLLERFIHPALTTVLQFAYISYYPMAALLGVVLLSRGKRPELSGAVFGIVLCYYLSYIGYLLIPAVGPRYTLAPLQTADLQASSLVIAIQETLNRLENTKTDAFPSGHTAIALMTLYYAVTTKEKALTALLIPFVTGLVVSTVYLRYHYVIDVLAGAVLAGLTIYLAPRLLPLFSRTSGHAGDQFHDPAGRERDR
jgi:membrane-associated phospholipid phosphatase